MRIILESIVAAAVIAGAPGIDSGAASVLPGFTDSLVTAGLSDATAMAFAPDGRIFVCEQAGRVRVIENGVLLADPFVMVPVDPSGERGLLGIAFDPAFNSNHYLYIYYTAVSPTIHNRIRRFTASGNVAVPGSEMDLLDLDDLAIATNHNGGALHFGVDGKLYAGVGDNANGSNAQTLANLLGKMLRINADGTIPTDNPFYNQTVGRNRAIWALGLRNPYTFAFNASGRLFINDVGQSTYEEVNEGVIGSNYGWPESEGPTNNPNHRGPLYYYPHVNGQFGGCAVTGGTFYEPLTGQFPSEYLGTYFFADLCQGWIDRLDIAGHNMRMASVLAFASGISFPVDLDIGPDGSLYYLARGPGSVRKIRYTGVAPLTPPARFGSPHPGFSGRIPKP